jgi:hypothetical protein
MDFNKCPYRLMVESKLNSMEKKIDTLITQIEDLKSWKLKVIGASMVITVIFSTAWTMFKFFSK